MATTADVAKALGGKPCHTAYDERACWLLPDGSHFITDTEMSDEFALRTIVPWLRAKNYEVTLRFSAGPGGDVVDAEASRGERQTICIERTVSEALCAVVLALRTEE